MFPMSVNLSTFVDQEKCLPVKADLNTVSNPKELFDQLKLNPPPKYEFVVDGRTVSFEKLKDLKKDDSHESDFGIIDTQINKTKEELGVDFIKIGRCIFIFEESKTVYDYLQFYKFKGYKIIKQTKEMTQRIVKESRLFMKYELLTYKDIEDRMDLEDKKVQEMKNELETLADSVTCNAKMKKRTKTLERRIKEIKSRQKYTSMTPVFAGQKKRRIPYYSNIEFPAMEFFRFNKSLKRPIPILQKDEAFSKFFIEKLRESGALICGSYALTNLFREKDMRSFNEIFRDTGKRYWNSKDMNDHINDIDIFSFNLKFLREIVEYLFQTKEYLEISCFKFYRLDSYKISCIESLMPINIVHLGDNFVPEDLVDLSPELNRKKIMDFMCERFDISACITCHDGEKFHYNDSVEKKLFDCRYSTKTRVAKYISRGFSINENLESNKEFDQVLYSNRPEDS